MMTLTWPRLRLKLNNSAPAPMPALNRPSTCSTEREKTHWLMGLSQHEAIPLDGDAAEKSPARERG